MWVNFSVCVLRVCIAVIIPPRGKNRFTEYLLCAKHFTYIFFNSHNYPSMIDIISNNELGT